MKVRYGIIGKLDKDCIFISHYILFLKSSEILSYEKNILSNYPFANYLKYRNIGKFTTNKLPIIDENYNTIGGIILIQML